MWQVRFDVEECDGLGVLTTRHHRLVRFDGIGSVVFSYARKGNGIDLHFAASKQALRHLREVIIVFISWLFASYEWCEMIFAVIVPRSIERLALSLGFEFIASDGVSNAYILAREKL